MKIWRTRITLALIFLSAVSCIWEYSAFASAKAGAQTSAASLTAVQRDVADLRAARGTVSLSPTERADLSQRVRTAASAAKVSDQLLSIESGQESRDGGGATSHAPIYLRFGAVTLQQLDAFLGDMSAGNDAAGVSAIDLSAPQGADAQVKQNAETWTAEITLTQRVSDPAAAANP